jgi:hypothetical protein
MAAGLPGENPNRILLANTESEAVMRIKRSTQDAAAFPRSQIIGICLLLLSERFFYNKHRTCSPITLAWMIEEQQPCYKINSVRQAILTMVVDVGNVNHLNTSDLTTGYHITCATGMMKPSESDFSDDVSYTAGMVPCPTLFSIKRSFNATGGTEPFCWTQPVVPDAVSSSNGSPSNQVASDWQRDHILYSCFKHGIVTHIGLNNSRTTLTHTQSGTHSNNPHRQD